ncbi:transmembrane protein 182-like [Teleopsis dalmanni]|uniref:transmembrane protein 182-like n=1 Tax=Teleopsis dalmanni TaxID=139649 RepID=UPI0018CE2BCA|nr:transmembrane protein 182-like [Teleopsis dalmanni]
MQKASHIARNDSQENIPPTVNMKRRTLSGNSGVGVFVLAFALIVIAFATPSWLVSDYRITGAKLDRLGLWVHCFRSLPDVNDDNQRRFFVGCRWVYDPFTTGYDEIRGFLMPAFMIVTQFFYTIAFIGMLISGIAVLVFILCAGPDQKHFITLIKSLGFVQLGTGISASIAVIVFACFGNRNGWMPEHANNWFGWSFVFACVGSVLSLVAGVLFLTEANVQERKRRQFKASQTRFELVHGNA